VSLGGDPSQAVDDAVRRSARSGVFYAVSAGNDRSRACGRSPARAGAGTNNGIATVASTDSSDEEASSSNYGECVDIWAPGVRVVSTKAGGGMATKSGTSMAVPHVAGSGALFRSRHAVTPTSVERKLKASAKFPGTESKDGRSIRRLFSGGAAGF
jgi:aqualysin 1